MPNQQLIDHIKRSRELGYGDQDIEGLLLNAGHRQEDIRAAFDALGGGEGLEVVAQDVFQQPASEAKLPGIGELLKTTFTLYRSRFFVFIGIGLAPFVGSLIVAIGSYLGVGPLVFFGFLVVTFLNFLSTVALLFAVKDSNEGIDVAEAYRRGWRKLHLYAWMTVLTMLVVMGGFAMAVIPGVIFSIWFIFAAYVLVAEDRRGMSSLLRSKEYVSGYWVPVFLRFCALVPLLLAIALLIIIPARVIGEDFGNIAQSIAQLLLAPFAIAYSYTLYWHLTRIKPHLIGAEPSGKKGLFVFSAVLGILFFVVILALIVLIGFMSLANPPDVFP